MDFPLLTDAKNIIIKHLHQFGLRPTGTSTQDVLRSYFNLKHKIISQSPRKVLWGDSLIEKAERLKVERVLNIIARKFEIGEDVNPFLSKGIFKLDDHDYLLNDWGMHHLHLNDKKNTTVDYFNQRSDLLLFAHVEIDKVYFIDIRPHNESYVFAQRDLLRSVRDNWPDLNRKFLVKEEEMEVFPKFDEKDIAIMRKKGYMFFTQVDKHAYMPDSGSTCSGFSLKASMEMDEFQRHLYKLHCYIMEHEDDLKIKFSTQPGGKLTKMRVSLAFKDWTFYICEMYTQRLVDIDVSNYQPPYADA